ncbi:MAG: SDR family NAD(P)-dependent oxidoreductase [Pseudomonadota bacterium]
MPGKVALVTGANQGLGLALVKGLAAALGPGSTVYLGARDAARGADAASALPTDGAGIEPILIDVTRDEDVARAAENLSARHGGVDIVISNAAARMLQGDAFPDIVSTFVDTNNGGQRRMAEHFVPRLRDGGVFLPVASSFGSLTKLPDSLHARFDTSTATLDDIDRVLADWVRGVEDGTAAEDGWPEWINIPSKIGQVASMRVLARDLANDPRALLIAAVCPGLVDTEASRPWFDDMSQALSPDDAAKPIVAIATGRVDRAASYGQLCRKGTMVPWT